MQDRSIEVYIADLLCKYAPLIMPKTFEHSDRPDIRFQIEGKRFGIEVTRYFWPNQQGIPHQATENYLYDFNKALNAYSETAGTYGCMVSVHMELDRIHDPKYRANLRDQLINFCKRQVVDENLRIEFHQESLPDNLLELGLRAIIIHSIPRLSQTIWSFPTASFIPRLLPATVEKIIRDKERMLENYKRSTDEVWLLIAFNIGGLASYVDPESEAFKVTYSTRFDRVIALHPPIAEDLRITTLNPP